jgi:hypothetical protein
MILLKSLTYLAHSFGLFDSLKNHGDFVFETPSESCLDFQSMTIKLMWQHHFGGCLPAVYKESMINNDQ